MKSVVVYGDVSPNVIDGSSIWLISTAEVLSRIFDDVVLLLKAPLENRRLISSLETIDNIRVYEPEAQLSAVDAAKRTEGLVQNGGVKAVVVRGMDACNAFCQAESIKPILFSYVTDLPFPPEKISENNLNRLRRIAAGSLRMFSQTEASRSYLEAICPEAAGKTSLMRPMIPEKRVSANSAASMTETCELQKSEIGSRNRPLKIIYSGKFAKAWKTLEMLKLPTELSKVGVFAELVVVGDKYNKDLEDPSWVVRMKDSLRQAASDSESGVTWRGALGREESLGEIAKADLGLGWRSVELDSSLEISTKALEYSILGVAPIINRTGDHEQIFGDDYPFFVDAEATTETLAKTIRDRLPMLSEAQKNAEHVASVFTMDETVDYLKTVFDRCGVLSPLATNRPHQPVKLLIASHDMKFMGDLMAFLERDARFEVKLDRWSTLHMHDERESRRLARWADVVFCEWAGPALHWYSRNLPGGRKLYSRLHRFEINGNWMHGVDWQRVSGLVFVSQFMRDEVVRKFGLDNLPTHIIPNSIDSFDLDRQKLPRAQFHIGLAGYVPFIKRPDRAIRMLSALLEEDERYTLHLKGRLPWDYSYEWNKSLQKQAYLEFFDQLLSNSNLKQRVVFEPFSADIASWYRGIGVILSPSSLESFHLAPAEGMASGSFPVVWPRNGADEIFGRYVAEREDDAIDRILQLRDPVVFRNEGQCSKQYAKRWDFEILRQKWVELFTENLTTKDAGA